MRSAMRGKPVPMGLEPQTDALVNEPLVINNVRLSIFYLNDRRPFTEGNLIFRPSAPNHGGVQTLHRLFLHLTKSRRSLHIKPSIPPAQQIIVQRLRSRTIHGQNLNGMAHAHQLWSTNAPNAPHCPRWRWGSAPIVFR